MPASIDCYLCLLRQSLEAARFATDNEKIHQEAVFSGMRLVLDEDPGTPPPIIGRAIHRLIKERTGNPDPYRAEKEKFNRGMLEQLSNMRERVESSADPLETAVRLGIAGNSIDFALGVVRQADVDRAFDAALTLPINGSVKELRDAVERSESILFLTDNAGEIVCDRLLIERLAGAYGKQVTVAVRGAPIINDATLDDARAAGLTEIPNVTVIDNGNDGLGTFLDECSETFLGHFTGDSLVIAKGLANYETLVENKTRWRPKKIAFLFKAKCPFISHYSGTKLGDLVVRLM